jgi:phytoene desaturase
MLTHPDRNRPVDPAPDNRPPAVVIGSGFGGLAAAVRLAARGYRVTVVERLDRPGGRASVLSQDGFTFDRGPTIVTAPFLFDELWALAGARMADDVDLRSLSPFYRLRFDDGSTIDCGPDAEVMRATVAALSPDDLPGYDRFMALSREICRVGFEGLSTQPFGRLADMLRIAPDLVRLDGWRTVHAVVARHVRDPRLRVMLSFHPLLIGGNPFRAPAIYCLIPDLEKRWGVHYPIGGVGRLVQGLVSLVERQGGSVLLGTGVSRILVENGRATGVELEDGRHLPAAVVVSNADASRTYSDLVGNPGGGRPAAARLRPPRHSMGLFVWYFGVRGHYDDVGHHTILLGPRYRDLLADIFDRGRLADDFSIYLHRPSATDPSVAPEGHDTFYALCPVPNLAGDVDWSRAAETRRAAIQRRLEETLLPGLSERIVTSHVTTPVDFRDDYLSELGAGFGLEPVLLQSAWFRPHNASPSVTGLYLVGAGTHPGAGIPGVLSSARILDAVVPHASALAH